MSQAAGNPQVEPDLVSVVFLECATFREEFPALPPCCGQCHQYGRRDLLYVRPMRDEAGNADWFLCVEAIICCHLYHFVRSLPREWWVEKAEKYGVKREDQRGYIYSAHPEHNTERSSSPTPRNVSQAKIKETLRKEKEREEGGLASFLRRR